MPTNYRSTAAVVDAGNALMKGRGAPGRPARPELGQVGVYDLAEFERTSAEEDRHGDTITPAVLRLVKQFFDRGEDVVLLSRNNRVGSWVNYGPNTTAPASDLGRFRDHLRSAIPQEDRRRLTISTTHSYKGLQSAAVIVVDATIGRYPLVHPSWSFSRVFGESVSDILDAERQLFYVALTRAENSVAIVTERGRRSPFLDALGRPDQPWPTTRFPSLDGARFEVRVSNAYDVREDLKALGYRFGQDREYEHGKYWWSSHPVEGFELATLRKQSWARPEVRIEVFADGILVDST